MLWITRSPTPAYLWRAPASGLPTAVAPRTPRPGTQARPKPRIAPPAEHHVRVQPVIPRHRSHRTARLERLGHHLLLVSQPIIARPRLSSRQVWCPSDSGGHYRPPASHQNALRAKRLKSGKTGRLPHHPHTMAISDHRILQNIPYTTRSAGGRSAEGDWRGRNGCPGELTTSAGRERPATTYWARP